ncbi:DUF736 family protein [Phyllobacterium sp. P30BS-XVII]|uniref:DUF736 family protein n=1 Tax=Phyllobacterium sp. P30BS-XVII TaxID=2587046 RepID=UPI0015FD8794|nr:DUF736 family protein [Phyllobacterium sp. P30BS-XVII]MBA8904118.1 uncharacterized protein (DUF736 family) [Phyllobacterium sp. P30BS-XVII]
MTDTLVNFIQINDNGTISGNIATVAFDIDITGEKLNSDNPKAPVFKLFAKTPRGRKIEIGGIWEKTSVTKGTTYYTLSVNTGYDRLNANLGRYPGQDDSTLMAVIPWD